MVCTLCGHNVITIYRVSPCSTSRLYTRPLPRVCTLYHVSVPPWLTCFDPILKKRIATPVLLVSSRSTAQMSSPWGRLYSFRPGDVIIVENTTISEWNDQTAEIVGKVCVKSDGSRWWPVRIPNIATKVLIKEDYLILRCRAFMTQTLSQFSSDMRQEMSKCCLDLNDCIKAMEEDGSTGLETFDICKFRIAWRFFVDGSFYTVFYQLHHPVVAFMSTQKDIILEFLNFELKKGSLIIAWGWLKDAFDRYLFQKGIHPPWLAHKYCHNERCFKALPKSGNKTKCGGRGGRCDHRYCSRRCQKRHWSAGHRLQCSK